MPAGSLVFQPSPERRRTGSHYTPRTLTGPIVTKALEPILRRLGPNPTPEALLALKVCDPAMGSGAFLVEAMRQLAKLLVEAWNHHGNPPRIPADETPILFASRLIAQRCLYGVDKNRMAVDLAKLSLWLATLAKDHAFSFLDHNFRHGDSLVGLSLAQIEACHWAPEVQQGFVSAASAIGLPWRSSVGKRSSRPMNSPAMKNSATFASKPTSRSISFAFWVMRYLVYSLKVAQPRPGSAARGPWPHDPGLPERRDRYAHPARLAARHRATGCGIARNGAAVEPFHWEIEFPEVFLKTRKDGSLLRGADRGFDAIVGNPPFAGKNTMAEGNAKGYPTGSKWFIPNLTATPTWWPISSAVPSTLSEPAVRSV